MSNIFKSGRGGFRPGSGVKPGTQNALKRVEDRRSIKKMITFTPVEWRDIEAEMDAELQPVFNLFARDKIIKKR